MPLAPFAAEFVEELSRGSVGHSVRTEQALEREFVIPIASRIASRQRDVLLFTHPFRSKRRCAPQCASEPPAGPGRVSGCPRCWAASKSWACIAVLGTHHTFDLVAKDHSQTLAIELKLVSARGGRMPNGELQRFMGQCSLAATKHNLVIGFCAYRGRLDRRWHEDTERVTKWFAGRNVQLVFRPVT